MKHLKEEFDKLTIKDVLVYSLAIVSIVAAFVLLFLGLLIPPEGEIHDSVLTAYGLTLLFVGSLLGISMRIESELNKFKSSITERVDALTRKSLCLHQIS